MHTTTYEDAACFTPQLARRCFCYRAQHYQDLERPGEIRNRNNRNYIRWRIKNARGLTFPDVRNQVTRIRYLQKLLRAIHYVR